jgi:sphingomyelin phosphodiesterase acid-like 3
VQRETVTSDIPVRFIALSVWSLETLRYRMERFPGTSASLSASKPERRPNCLATRTAMLLLILGFLAGVPCATAVPHGPQAGTATVAVGPDQGTFLMLSDIHFDPFFEASQPLIHQLASSPVEKWQSIFESRGDGEVSPDGADSNYALLKSALRAAGDSGTRYDYIVLTGDFLGHQFQKKYRSYVPGGSGYQVFVVKTIVFVNRMIEQTFPGVPIYGALGNNDSIGGDYAAPGRAIFSALIGEWKVIGAHPDARRDFLRGGYYAVPHPTVSSQEFVVLDTSFWSNRYRSSGPSNAADPGSAEIHWLAAKLSQLQSAHKTAALIMHIPPGVDAYASSKLGSCGHAVPFWKKAYLDSFMNLVAKHRDVVRDSYAGHTHMDDFRVFADGTGMPYFQTHIIPSIGRDHHNSPAFETGVYDQATGALVDYEVIYLKSSSSTSVLEKTSWAPEYDFREASGFPSYSPSSLETIATLIRSSAAIRQRFIDFYTSRMPASLSGLLKDWRFYSCAQTEIAPAAFSKCVCPPPSAGG